MNARLLRETGQWVIENAEDGRLLRITDVGVTLGAVMPAIYRSQDHAQRSCDALMGILAGHNVRMSLKPRPWEGA